MVHLRIMIVPMRAIDYYFLFLDDDDVSDPSPSQSDVEMFIELDDSRSDSSDIEIEEVSGSGAVPSSSSTIERSESPSSADVSMGWDRNCCYSLRKLWERANGVGPMPDELCSAFAKFIRDFDKKNGLCRSMNKHRQWNRRRHHLINRPSSPIIVSDGDEGESASWLKEEITLVDLCEENQEAARSPEPIPSTSTQNLDDISKCLEQSELSVGPSEAQHLSPSLPRTIYRPRTAEDFYSYLDRIFKGDCLDSPSFSPEHPSHESTTVVTEEPKSDPARSNSEDAVDDDAISDTMQRPASVT